MENSSFQITTRNLQMLGKKAFLCCCFLFANLFSAPFLLTDPFLQLSKEKSLKIVWFTSKKGEEHFAKVESAKIDATSNMISGWINLPAHCQIYRHEALIENIPPDKKLSYHVVSYDNNHIRHKSSDFPLSSFPSKEKDLVILLTSDHQCRELIPLQLEAAKKTIGTFDAIFYAGDFANTINSFPYLFTHPCAIFTSLQGKARLTLHRRGYKGARLLQTTPLIPAFGNHDVVNFGSVNKNALTPSWLFFNELFSLPLKTKSDPPYYSIKIGKIYLIVLAVARTYQSRFSHVPIEEGSKQYRWLLKKLQDQDFQNAEFRIVMMHHPIYTLKPDPFPFICASKETFSPEKNPHLSLKDTLVPLFEKYRVDLVFNGHDHIWNHFVTPGGVHFLSSCKSDISPKNTPLKHSSHSLSASFPNKKQFRVNRRLVPYPSGQGTTFSIFDTKNNSVESYICFFNKSRPCCIKFDTFYLKKRK